MVTSHPSLNASVLEIEPLVPVETMGPYEMCWCRSGKKYKWCHFRRDRQPKINIFQIEQRMLAVYRDGYCSYPDPKSDPCSDTIIKSHTVQKKGGLAAIAEKGHVLTVKPTMKNLIDTEGNPEPRKMGVNNASVFPGFCGKHDNAIFGPIEGKTLTLDINSAFLFSYRAVSYERYSKVTQRKAIEVQRDVDSGHPFWKQAAIQQSHHAMMAGIEIGIRDVEGWKSGYDERLVSGNLRDFHFLAVRFDRVIPLVACSLFHPEFDFQGNTLQKLGTTANEFDSISITVTTFDSRTILVLGWIGDADCPADKLARSFLAIEDERKADALVRLLFVHTENLFIQPSWWDGLPLLSQDALKKLLKAGTTMLLRSSKDLRNDGIIYFSAGVEEVVSG